MFINNWAYQELQIQVLNDPTSIAFKPQQVSVDNLCLAYLQHAKEETPDHFSGIKTAVEIKTTEFFVNKHFDRLIIYFFATGITSGEGKRLYCIAKALDCRANACVGGQLSPTQ